MDRDPGKIGDFYNYPNPFNPETESTTFRCDLDNADIYQYKWTLEIFAENGNPVYSAENTVSGTPVATPLLITWAGRDNRGNVVGNGIYTSILTIEVMQDSSNYTGNTYEISFRTAVQ
jgi:flagellar hook assembly protein FlgD